MDDAVVPVPKWKKFTMPIIMYQNPNQSAL